MVQRSEMENMKVLNEGQLTVGFDTTITHKLLLEGIARDIVRAVQNLRKDQGFDVADRIELTVSGNSLVSESFTTFNEYIARETLADSTTFVKHPEAVEIPCGDTVAFISATKVS